MKQDSSVYGLVDCNNFFVSCEQVFRPNLVGLPVVVLSNNDSVVISRSNEAKAIGVKMGAAIWEVEKLLKTNNGIVCSSNYELYGDMSARVMATLRQMAPDVDVYSIDEAFLDLSGMNERINLLEYGKNIVKTIRRNIGIPVSVGIDSTKTLAKLCSHYAKKHPESKSITYIETEEDRDNVLKFAKIDDVWGIGRKTGEFLRSHGIETAYQFAQCSDEWVNNSLKMPGVRTWAELTGISCIHIDDVNLAKKQICTSRSFGKDVTDKNELAEAITYFADLCSKKLRDQQSMAKSMAIFFRIADKDSALSSRYMFGEQVIFPVATDSTLEIAKFAIEALEKIFVEKTIYKKAGVIITEVVSNRNIQQNLFDIVDREKHKRLMGAIDNINFRYGNNKIRIATQGFDNNWKMKREFLSRGYSTNLQDIIEVKSE